LARTPFFCSFRTGWRRFSLCSVHIYYGKAKNIDTRRLGEIERLAKFLATKNTRRQRDDNGEPESIIVLGDFNIFSREDPTFQALVKHRFVVPEIGKTNLGEDKYFDQIAFHDPRGLLWPKEREMPLKEIPRKGVFRFLNSVFRDCDSESYEPEMQATCAENFAKAKDKKAFFNKWRTFQMSDHFPLWGGAQHRFFGRVHSRCRRPREGTRRSSRG
jgi:hypothetical protein